MKLLFDQNISFRLTRKLIDIYPESKHVSDCGLLNSEDPEIWDYARKNGYTIVTFDLDFYDISLINGHPPKVIWIREENSTTNAISRLLIENKEIIGKFIQNDEYSEVSCLTIE